MTSQATEKDCSMNFSLTVDDHTQFTTGDMKIHPSHVVTTTLGTQKECQIDSSSRGVPAIIFNGCILSMTGEKKIC